MKIDIQINTLLSNEQKNTLWEKSIKTILKNLVYGVSFKRHVTNFLRYVSVNIKKLCPNRRHCITYYNSVNSNDILRVLCYTQVPNYHSGISFNNHLHSD
jgi:hypothetical protein